MQWQFVLISFIGLVLVFAVIHKLSGRKNPVRRALLSIVCGLACLLAVNALSGITGVSLPISPLSAAVSAAGGVPGVTLLLLLEVVM